MDLDGAHIFKSCDDVDHCSRQVFPNLNHFCTDDPKRCVPILNPISESTLLRRMASKYPTVLRRTIWKKP